MVRTILRILGAACSAVLLYFSYDSQSEVIFALTAILVLIAVTDNANSILQCSLVCIFYCMFICAQWLFIVSDVVNGDSTSAMLLLPFTVFLIHTVPVCLCIILFKRSRIESMLIGMLLAEFLFVQFNLGNQCFQMGTILAATPSFIKFFRVTGIWGGSFLIVFTGYSFYRIIHNKKWWIPMACVYGAIICMNIFLQQSNEHARKRKDVGIVSLGMENERVERANMMISDSIATSCDYILWPESVVVKKESAYVYDPLITRCMRLVSHFGTVSFFGLNTIVDNSPTNSVIVVRETGISRRFKEHLIPFSEYIPYKAILGRIPVVRNNILYPLKDGDTSYHMSDNENICPLICYESISTEYLYEQVKKGAELFFVSSSNEYIDDRHIEEVTKRILQANAVIFNREIVRAVTNGLSLHIDNNGNANEQPYNHTSVKIVSAGFMNDYTFYTEHKTIIETIYFISLLLLLFIRTDRERSGILLPES